MTCKLLKPEKILTYRGVDIYRLYEDNDTILSTSATGDKEYTFHTNRIKYWNKYRPLMWNLKRTIDMRLINFCPDGTYDPKSCSNCRYKTGTLDYDNYLLPKCRLSEEYICDPYQRMRGCLLMSTKHDDYDIDKVYSYGQGHVS